MNAGSKTVSEIQAFGNAPVGVGDEGASGRVFKTELRVRFQGERGKPIDIFYSLESSRLRVRLALYDVRGRQVRLLEQGVRDAGSYRRTWDGRNDRGARAARGVYFVLLRAGDTRRVQKLVLLHGVP